jgi:hypothetical protein
MASGDHIAQNTFNPLQLFDLSTHGLQFVLGQDTGFLAVGTIFQPKQVDNLIETEAQVLRRFHERQSIDIGLTPI